MGAGVDWNTDADGYEGVGFGWTVGGGDTWELDDMDCIIGPDTEEDCARAALAAAFTAFFSILFFSFSSFFLILSVSCTNVYTFAHFIYQSQSFTHV